MPTVDPIKNITPPESASSPVQPSPLESDPMPAAEAVPASRSRLTKVSAEPKAIPKVSAKNKEDLLDAITPQRNGPVFISTSTAKKSIVGPLGLFFLVLLIAALGALGYGYREYISLKQQVRDSQPPSTPAQGDETGASGEGFAKRVKSNLQSGMQTQLVQTDADLKLAQQLYAGAKYGDQLIAINGVQFLYDPLADVIEAVQSGVVQTSKPANTSTPVSAATSTPAKIVNIEIRNGSGVTGAAAKAAQTFATSSTYKVVKTGNASKQTYAQTVVVNLKGVDVSALASQYGVTPVTTLPAGEAASTADVVVILGK